MTCSQNYIPKIQEWFMAAKEWKARVQKWRAGACLADTGIGVDKGGLDSG